MEASSLSVVREITLSYSHPVKPSLLPKISNSREAYLILLESWDKGKIEFVEQFKMMLLNRANRVLGICTVSTGSTAGTVVDVRLIFATALKANACGIILAHNHPSGNIEPSEADKRLTRKITEAGKLLDVPVLDHLIVTTEGHYSFAEEGLL